MKPLASTAAAACAIAVLLAGVGPSAFAADRPYLLTNNAAAEEDDDGVWSFESFWQRTGSLSLFSVAPEYAFSPTTSVQFELSSERDRDDAGRTQELEIEFKHLFNHIARDGWGWGLVASLSFATDEGTGWRRSAWALRVPLSWQIGSSGVVLHANAGVARERDGPRLWQRSLAAEREVARHLVAFVELGRVGETTLAHGGIRYWVRREKIAVDLSMLRQRSSGMRDSGAVLGLAFYDL